MKCHGHLSIIITVNASLAHNEQRMKTGLNTFVKTRDDESSLESHCFRKPIAAACVRFEDWVSSKIVVRAGYARIVTSFGRLSNSAASSLKMA